MLFCGGRVLVARCDAAAQLFGARTVHVIQSSCHRGCLVLAATDDGRGFGVVLAQVGECFGIVRIERRSRFQLRFYPFGEAVGLDEGDAVRLLSQCSSVPEVIVTAVPVQCDSFRAGGHCIIPPLQL